MEKSPKTKGYSTREIMEGSGNIEVGTEHKGNGNTYVAHKLLKQANNNNLNTNDIKSSIFNNCLFNINGIVDPPLHEFINLILTHGGHTQQYQTNITHFVCNRFTEQQLKIRSEKVGISNSYHIITSDWVIDSIKLGRRLNESMYIPEQIHHLGGNIELMFQNQYNKTNNNNSNNNNNNNSSNNHNNNANNNNNNNNNSSSSSSSSSSSKNSSNYYDNNNNNSNINNNNINNINTNTNHHHHINSNNNKSDIPYFNSSRLSFIGIYLSNISIYLSNISIYLSNCLCIYLYIGRWRSRVYNIATTNSNRVIETDRFLSIYLSIYMSIYL
jgi:hypothetical protein